MKNLTVCLTAAALVAASLVGKAQIARLSLEDMTTLTDNGIVGTIVGQRVIDLSNDYEGQLIYTVLTIEGESLVDGRKTTVDVVKRGGWLDRKEGIGVWDSEAPSDEETEIGKRIVAYYHWVDNIGSGVGANRLFASHGSLFRTVEGPNGLVVMGRGDGYAIANNMKLESLRQATRAILEDTAKTQLESSL